MESSGRIRIGTAGWSYKDWEGIVYAARVKSVQHPAGYLARYFDVIEISTSFYAPIKPEPPPLRRQCRGKWARGSRALPCRGGVEPALLHVVTAAAGTSYAAFLIFRLFEEL